MKQTTHTFQSTAEMIDALRQARDEARVQLHLGSVEARQRWGEIEEKLIQLEDRLERGLEDIADQGIHAVAEKVTALTQRARGFLTDTKKAHDGSKPDEAGSGGN